MAPARKSNKSQYVPVSRELQIMPKKLIKYFSFTHLADTYPMHLTVHLIQNNHVLHFMGIKQGNKKPC